MAEGKRGDSPMGCWGKGIIIAGRDKNARNQRQHDTRVTENQKCQKSPSGKFPEIRRKHSQSDRPDESKHTHRHPEA